MESQLKKMSMKISILSTTMLRKDLDHKMHSQGVTRRMTASTMISISRQLVTMKLTMILPPCNKIIQLKSKTFRKSKKILLSLSSSTTQMHTNKAFINPQ